MTRGVDFERLHGGVRDALIDELTALRAAMLDYESRISPWIHDVDPRHRASAGNLAHYLAMRRVDLRRLQDRLAWIGLSSLGRAEDHALANLDKVLGLLHLLAAGSRPLHGAQEPAGVFRGRKLLERNAEALFGAPAPGRTVRIMVTLPSEAAWDAALVDGLVAGGMDIARINCAHDDAQRWMEMAARVRASAAEAGRPVRVLMDLGGPKLRTGPLPDGPAVLRLRPLRDALGVVGAPFLLGLHAIGSERRAAGAVAHVGVPGEWLARLSADDAVEVTDARGAERSLKVLRAQRGTALLEGSRTTYLTPQTALRRRGGDGGEPRECLPEGIAAQPGALLLSRGDLLRLVRKGMGRPAARRSGRPAIIACTLPQALAAIGKGDRVWFDDGRIGGVVRSTSAKGAEIEITVARDGGEKLRADKGINLPDSVLHLPALTDKDIEDLAVVARHADLVGLSFAQSADDVRELRRRLQDLDAAHVGVVLKIETRRGFEHLPEMLFAAMGACASGVMIARGDLAVECGYERMAEVQEEILCACEAAHVPVVWATQVLESLARTGRPSRAEITDAAMGERAECVMLNKGPFILDAVRMLDDILRRMQSHQAKKRPLLRALKSWRPPPDDPARGRGTSGTS